MIPAIRNGYFQREIADAAYRYQQEIDAGERDRGRRQRVRRARRGDPDHPAVDPAGEARQTARLAAVRAAPRRAPRSSARWPALRRRAEGGANLMPALVDCARAYASWARCATCCAGCSAYRETPVF